MFKGWYLKIPHFFLFYPTDVILAYAGIQSSESKRKERLFAKRNPLIIANSLL